MSLLEVDNLSILIRGGRNLVEGVSITVNAGEIVGIAGESGSGKTVTAMTSLGFLPAGATSTGEVRVNGVDVLSMTPKQLQSVRGTEVAMVFQDPMTSLHPMLNIGTQLTEHLRVHKGLGRKAAWARAAELLEMVRIPDPTSALTAFPHRFSGGMRQRIAIAMALACDPKLLIADEITTALDVTVQAGILDLLDRLRKETGMAVVFITHDLAVMNVIADRLYVMYGGRLAESGSIGEVLNSTRHPYTRALIEALPEGAALGKALVPIPGEPSTPDRRPSGCAFNPRCTFAVESCRTDVPELRELEPGHFAACAVDPFGSLPEGAIPLDISLAPRKDQHVAS
ncbi:ABC transporter ATP-binding protein [Salinibacterium sp. SWN1162]|uniref:ABC transporter ATP-binding protein n=1 Tax=Salinibacterium sp. SWN1162 TaxID=2792053 RepID=UPI0018CE9675|nr:ABC transporter ATP-binding protein [Salinibacterium sp. SWN1162]MBH0007872.1 ABC transporter ATP-binding protein [Salinibacterium sp. SWN1162]